MLRRLATLVECRDSRRRLSLGRRLSWVLRCPWRTSCARRTAEGGCPHTTPTKSASLSPYVPEPGLGLVVAETVLSVKSSLRVMLTNNGSAPANWNPSRHGFG